eukprot:6542026-Prymnesium_polylepis.2
MVERSASAEICGVLMALFPHTGDSKPPSSTMKKSMLFGLTRAAGTALCKRVCVLAPINTSTTRIAHVLSSKSSQRSYRFHTLVGTVFTRRTRRLIHSMHSPLYKTMSALGLASCVLLSECAMLTFRVPTPPATSHVPTR